MKWQTEMWVCSEFGHGQIASKRKVCCAKWQTVSHVHVVVVWYSHGTYPFRWWLCQLVLQLFDLFLVICYKITYEKKNKLEFSI